MTADELMTAAQAATLKELAEAAYELDAFKPNLTRTEADNLAEQAPRSVMLFRGWMLKDLKRAGALVGARVFWSQWDGYARCIAFYLLSRLGFAAR